MFVSEIGPPSPRRRKRAVNRRVQGDIGEASAIEWLTGKGALVWVPIGHSPDVDLIAETEDRLLRVQVKTSTLSRRLPSGDVRWTVSIATYGGNRSWSGVTKRFDPKRIDYLFALVGDGRRWFIPASCVEARRAIALGGSKYSGFEIEGGTPFEGLVYANRNAAPLSSVGLTGRHSNRELRAMIASLPSRQDRSNTRELH